MKPLLIAGAVACVLQLSGCASQWVPPRQDAEAGLPDQPAAANRALPVRLQQMTLEAAGVEMRKIKAQDLQVGDILLSGMTTLRSSAIKLATFSKVSHAAIYVGDGQVVEAVGSGVRLYGVEQALSDGETIVAYRHPDATPEQQVKVKSFALEQVGVSYNLFGIVMQAPLSMERKLCEIPGIPGDLRHACVKTVGQVQMAPTRLDRRPAYFCSELVLEAFKAAGTPLADVPSELVAPSDLLHMREGDVSTFTIPRRLGYVGRLAKEELREAQDAGPAPQSRSEPL